LVLDSIPWQHRKKIERERGAHNKGGEWKVKGNAARYRKLQKEEEERK
jgi:hypothetical protein